MGVEVEREEVLKAENALHSNSRETRPDAISFFTTTYLVNDIPRFLLCPHENSPEMVDNGDNGDNGSPRAASLTASR